MKKCQGWLKIVSRSVDDDQKARSKTVDGGQECVQVPSMKGQRYDQELARGKKILFSSKAQDIDHAANARPEESAHERLFDPGHVGG